MNMEKRKELEFYLLIPTYNAPKITMDEFVLVMSKGEKRKPILLTCPRHRFSRKLNYYKKLSWN